MFCSQLNINSASKLSDNTPDWLVQYENELYNFVTQWKPSDPKEPSWEINQQLSAAFNDEVQKLNKKYGYPYSAEYQHYINAMQSSIYGDHNFPVPSGPPTPSGQVQKDIAEAKNIVKNLQDQISKDSNRFQELEDQTATIDQTIQNLQNKIDHGGLSPEEKAAAESDLAKAKELGASLKSAYETAKESLQSDLNLLNAKLNDAQTILKDLSSLSDSEVAKANADLAEIQSDQDATKDEQSDFDSKMSHLSELAASYQAAVHQVNHDITPPAPANYPGTLPIGDYNQYANYIWNELQKYGQLHGGDLNAIKDAYNKAWAIIGVHTTGDYTPQQKQALNAALNEALQACGLPIITPEVQQAFADAQSAKDAFSSVDLDALNTQIKSLQDQIAALQKVIDMAKAVPNPTPEQQKALHDAMTQLAKVQGELSQATALLKGLSNTTEQTELKEIEDLEKKIIGEGGNEARQKQDLALLEKKLSALKTSQDFVAFDKSMSQVSSDMTTAHQQVNSLVGLFNLNLPNKQGQNSYLDITLILSNIPSDCRNSDGTINRAKFDVYINSYLDQLAAAGNQTVDLAFTDFSQIEALAKGDWNSIFPGTSGVNDAMKYFIEDVHAHAGPNGNPMTVNLSFGGERVGDYKGLNQQLGEELAQAMKNQNLDGVDFDIENGGFNDSPKQAANSQAFFKAIKDNLNPGQTSTLTILGNVLQDQKGSPMYPMFFDANGKNVFNSMFTDLNLMEYNAGTQYYIDANDSSWGLNTQLALLSGASYDQIFGADGKSKITSPAVLNDLLRNQMHLSDKQILSAARKIHVGFDDIVPYSSSSAWAKPGDGSSDPYHIPAGTSDGAAAAMIWKQTEEILGASLGIKDFSLGTAFWWPSYGGYSEGQNTAKRYTPDSSDKVHFVSPEMDHFYQYLQSHPV